MIIISYAKGIRDIQHKLMLCPVNNPLWMHEKALHSMLLRKKSIELNDPIKIGLNLRKKHYVFKVAIIIGKGENCIFKIIDECEIWSYEQNVIFR